MMKVLRTICLLSLLLPAVFLYAQEDVASLRRQADMHFRNSEWFQALRVYEKLLSVTKSDPKLYVDVIIASSHLNNKSNTLYFTEMARANQISMDTLFSRVQTVSRQLGKIVLYEDYLIVIKEEYPELSPSIDRRLVEYYGFRNDYAKLEKLVGAMLENDPANLSLRKMQADALFNMGHENQSVISYLRILDQYPLDTQSLLFLGSYYYVNGMKRLMELGTEYSQQERPTRMQFINYKQSQVEILEKYFDVAAGYLERARDIRSTPVIRKLLQQIEERRNTIAAARYIKSRN